MSLGNLLNKIENIAADNISTDVTDYIGEDGLLTCGKCHTSKQVRINFCGEIRTPYCICKCEQEKEQAENQKLRRAELDIQRRRNRNNAFPDSDRSSDPHDDMRVWRFEMDDGANLEITTAGKKYVEHFEEMKRNGKGLLYYGTVGVGKSFQAACIANALLDKGYSVLVTTFSRIERELFSAKDRQLYFDNLNSYQLLVLDDLGTERKTDYMNEIVYDVIDSRHRANLPLIVTSNLTAEALKHPTSQSDIRVFSRLLKMCHPIKFEGDDRRRQSAANSINEMKKILGI